MLIITIKEYEDNLFTDQKDMVNIEKAIVVEFNKRLFLNGLHKGFTVKCRTSELIFHFKGLIIEDKETSNYIARYMQNILDEIGLEEICAVSSITTIPHFGDQIVPLKYFKPEDTRNTNLLKGLINDDEIPEDYKCHLSDQVMDDPVHTTQRPDIYYDKSQLVFWLYSQDNPIDPLTTKNIRITSDVIDDLALKNKISTYVRDQIKTGLKKKQNAKNEIFVKTVRKYAPDVTQASIDKAFRVAAAYNNTEELGILIMKVSNINAQDDNPHRRRTALHWAVIKDATKSVEWLLQIGALVNIPDSTGKTALDYANQSNNTIKRLLNRGTEELELIQNFRI